MRIAFDPPGPPKQSLLEIARITLMAVALFPVMFVLYAPLELLALFSSVRGGRKAYAPPLHVPDDLTRTAPPNVTVDGSVTCTACAAAVPFATMSIDERGYFCSACAGGSV